MNRAEEDYLKAIYELTYEQKNDIVKLSVLTDHLGFTDQSVNAKVKSLEEKKYLKFIPYKGVSLTNKGLKEAILLIRKHRIWEVFLMQKLKFSWSDVHEDAEMLEHAGSTKVIDALYEYLGKPKYCQHGNPIPDYDGNILEVSRLSMNMLKENVMFSFARVSDNKELLNKLDLLNIKLNDEFLLESIDQINNQVVIKKDLEKFTFLISEAKMMFVNVIK